MADDPYLRPGDVVTLFKADRTVTLAGAVYRPGTYQLLPGETLKNLIDFYGSGLTDTARTDIATLVRHLWRGRPMAQCFSSIRVSPTSDLIL